MHAYQMFLKFAFLNKDLARLAESADRHVINNLEFSY